VRINVSCLYYPVCVFSYHDLNGPRWPVLTNCPSPILFIFFFCILMTIILRELEVFSLFLKYFECLINFHCSKHQFIKKKNRAKSLFRNLILLHLVSVLVFPISNIYTLVTYIGQAVSRTNKWNCANHTVLFKLWLPLSLFLPLIGNEIMLQHDLIGIGSIFINQEVSGKGT
jgi:hypothetical protein